MLAIGLMAGLAAASAAPSAAGQGPAIIWNAEKRIFVSYEDPESLRRKCRYLRERGLAGVMFWEYTADRTGALLDTLLAELRVRVGPR